MKDTFDKIVMDESKKEEIRGMLERKKAVRPRWTIAVAGVAAAIAVLMAVPVTRTAIVNAAMELGRKVFHTNQGLTVSVEKTAGSENGDYYEYFSVEFSENPSAREANVEEKDGRIYLVVNGNWTDITDKCSDSDYYRYESVSNDGSRTVLYIGGTPGDLGWFEFTYLPVEENDSQACMIISSEGNCSPENPTHEWERKALENEGIRSNDAPNLQISVN